MELEPVVPQDSPLFRASLAALEHQSELISKSCRSTLTAANSVLDILKSLELAEKTLFEYLGRLDELISHRDSSADSTRYEDHATRTKPSLEFDSPERQLVRDVGDWLSRSRRDEVDRLEGVLIHRLAGLRSHLKGRGVGNGSALAGFEVRQIIVGFCDSVYVDVSECRSTGCFQATLCFTESVPGTSQWRWPKSQPRRVYGS